MFLDEGAILCHVGINCKRESVSNCFNVCADTK